MNYPPEIYSNFEIVEKDIYGERHYGLVKHWKFLWFNFEDQQTLRTTGKSGYISAFGSSWVNSKEAVLSAIELDNYQQERKFREMVTK